MIVRDRIFQLFLAVSIVFAFYLSYLAVSNYEFTDKQGREVESLSIVRQLVNDKNRWKGELTAQTIKEIVKKENTTEKRYRDNIVSYGKEEQSYIDILFFANTIFYGKYDAFDDTLPITKENSNRIDRIYDIYRQNFRVELSKCCKNKAEREFIMKKFEHMKMPLKYEAFEPWEAVIRYTGAFSILLLLFATFLSAKIFIKEFQYKTVSIFFTTLHGKGKAIKSKMIANFIIVTILYWTGIGLFSLICFSVMGLSGGQTMLQFKLPYAIYVMTYNQSFGIVVCGGYIASLFSASFAMLMAYRTKGFITGLIASIILFIVIPFIVRAVGGKHSLIYLLPFNLNEVVNGFRTPLIYQMWGIAFRQIPFILLLYSTVTILLIFVTYRCYRNIIVEN